MSKCKISIYCYRPHSYKYKRKRGLILWDIFSCHWGGGADTSIVTASASDVIKNKVIVGPDGEPITGSLELTGNAGTGDVLSGKTFYNTNPKSKLTGTMANRGAVSSSLNCGGSYTIPAGYHNGSGRITANSLASQTSNANAGAGDIIAGRSAYVNGSKINGTMNTMDGLTISPNSSQQTISCAGKKMNGNIIINAVPSTMVDVSNWPVFDSGNIASGMSGNIVNYYYPNYGNSLISINKGVATETVNGISCLRMSYQNEEGIYIKRAIDLSLFKKVTFYVYFKSHTSTDVWARFTIYIRRSDPLSGTLKTNSVNDGSRTLIPGGGGTQVWIQRTFQLDISDLTGYGTINAERNHSYGVAVSKIQLDAA